MKTLLLFAFVHSLFIYIRPAYTRHIMNHLSNGIHIWQLQKHSDYWKLAIRTSRVIEVIFLLNLFYLLSGCAASNQSDPISTYRTICNRPAPEQIGLTVGQTCTITTESGPEWCNVPNSDGFTLRQACQIVKEYDSP